MESDPYYFTFYQIKLWRGVILWENLLSEQSASGIKFDLEAGNGEVIGTSEVYTTEAACANGIESVRKKQFGRKR